MAFYIKKVLTPLSVVKDFTASPAGSVSLDNLRMLLFARGQKMRHSIIYFLLLLFIRHLIFVFLLFSDSKFEGCQSSSRVFDQASRLQSWMGGHLLQLCTLWSHVLTNPELFGNWFLRKIRLKRNSVLESMTLTKHLWGVWMYLQFTNNFYFFKAIIANDKI